MRHGGSYTKKNKDSEPVLVERTLSIAEHKEGQPQGIAPTETEKKAAKNKKEAQS